MDSGLSCAECRELYARASSSNDSQAWAELKARVVSAFLKLLRKQVGALIPPSKQLRIAERAFGMTRRRASLHSTWESALWDARGILARLVIRVLALPRELASNHPRSNNGKYPAHGPSEILGDSGSMAKLRELVALAAVSHLNVLIIGETGTGKELVAREIHRLSPRQAKELVSHNCSVIPRDLFESEFFGHRRGAFTGAGEDHIGLLGRSDGSHLFLDELEAMSPEHQVKLLRVMEDGMVLRVGGRKMREVDVRYLAATNQDPKQLLVAGQLRQDLYYRLKGHVISLPPLRKRPEDIPCLARHFLKEAASALTADAIKTLQAYHWPGNVRELKQLVLAAKDLAFAARENRILPEHLAISDSQLAEAQVGAHNLTLEAALRNAERLAILEALAASHDNRNKAAQMLGIPRARLWRLLKRHRNGE